MCLMLYSYGKFPTLMTALSADIVHMDFDRGRFVDV